MAMIASYEPASAIFFAASGISNEPGTRTTSLCFADAPPRARASSAPASSLSVIKLLKRLTTMPKRMPEASKRAANFVGLEVFGHVAFTLSSFSIFPVVATAALAPRHSLSLKPRRPLLQKRLRALAHVLGRATQTEQRRLERQALLERQVRRCARWLRRSTARRSAHSRQSFSPSPRPPAATRPAHTHGSPARCAAPLRRKSSRRSGTARAPLPARTAAPAAAMPP